MMAHNNGCIVAVKVNGSVLRDVQGKKYDERDVFLRHDTEYEIYLKNKNSYAVAASIDIDGMDALGGRAMVVPSYGSVEIERFVVDGNLDKGKRFRFVSVASGDEGIVDPESKDNGLITVKFYCEKDCPTHEPRMVPISKKYFGGVDSTMKCSTRSMSFERDSLCDSFSVDSDDDNGATVEGGTSYQKFGTTNMQLEKHAFTTVKLRLRCHRDTVTTKDRQHCPECGRRINWGDVFCRACGHKLREEELCNCFKTRCSRCNAMVNRGDKYCPQCGFRVTNVQEDYVWRGGTGGKRVEF